MHLDEFNQILDSEAGERYDAVLFDAINPDKAILIFHSTGTVTQPVFLFAEIVRDGVYGRDVIDLSPRRSALLQRSNAFAAQGGAISMPSSFSIFSTS